MNNPYQKNIKKIRIFLGMNQEEFANFLDIKRVTLGSYEEGRVNMPLKTLKIMIDKLGMQNKTYDILFNENY